MDNVDRIVCLFCFTIVTALAFEVQTMHERTKRSTSYSATLEPGNWENCKTGTTLPTRVNTSERVRSLRNLFAGIQIQAYIIPSEDAHQSEYPSDYDKRRQYISGFSGSAGMAVVTNNLSALWTDGRYFIQAEAELDCNWILMRQGETGVQTTTEWLRSVLTANSKVGISPFLISSSRWKSYSDDLQKYNISLSKVNSELIDQIWTTMRPPMPSTVINALSMQFAGRSWQDKINDIHTKMAEKYVDLMVITSLDETAWLFNLRASDIAYNPFFMSYAIIDRTLNRTSLYIIDKDRKLTQNPNDNETSVKVHTHLETGPNGICSGSGGGCTEVKEYNNTAIEIDVEKLVNERNKVWVSPSCNYAIFSLIPETKVYQANTPATLMKAKKNKAEVDGMKSAHVRDAVALISFLAKLEKEVKEGKLWTELSAAEELEKYRRDQDYNRGLSFDSISGSGSNGAIIHYSVTNATNKAITTKEMYLLDSGGQYLDGTTDVTRTFHFGSPTDFEKECYTRVLMGHINLFLAKWPKGLYGREIDAFARGPLWDVGLVYRHGTGHGIGMYLSVHEGPSRISLSHSAFTGDEPLDEFQFLSNEPGYYEPNKFGIRIENIVMVTSVNTTYKMEGQNFLGFEHITFVPYEPNLIKLSMLSGKHIEYLNNYHKLIQEKVGPALKEKNLEAYDWMMQKTATISSFVSSGNRQPVNHAILIPILLPLFFIF
ncbi:hypothetical protein CHS0354_010927 [Potamilus streckersoni]|uniref:Xaa-Pro aminopeptidase 1 n=1 Tax=Potamilus streckersoni TaxID=2493646 RepID=A0AAE0STD2_9BIVA|nr:hypothetical protein CHS0354_010927 [Potamilus streckersoni]